jgi:hypothetical protein
MRHSYAAGRSVWGHRWRTDGNCQRGFEAYGRELVDAFAMLTPNSWSLYDEMPFIASVPAPPPGGLRVRSSLRPSRPCITGQNSTAESSLGRADVAGTEAPARRASPCEPRSGFVSEGNQAGYDALKLGCIVVKL